MFIYEHFVSEKPFFKIFLQIPHTIIVHRIRAALLEAGEPTATISALTDKDIISDVDTYLENYQVTSTQQITIDEVTHVRNPAQPDYTLSPCYGASISLIGDTEAINSRTDGTLKPHTPLALYFEAVFAPELYNTKVTELFGITISADSAALTDSATPVDSTAISAVFNDLLDADQLSNIVLDLRIHRRIKD